MGADAEAARTMRGAAVGFLVAGGIRKFNGVFLMPGLVIDGIVIATHALLLFVTFCSACGPYDGQPLRTEDNRDNEGEDDCQRFCVDPSKGF